MKIPIQHERLNRTINRATKSFSIIILSIRKYFLTGILVLVPLAVTLYIMFFLFQLTDGILGVAVAKSIGYRIPGLGLVFTALICVAVGLVAQNYFGKKVIDAQGNNFPLLIKYIDANSDLSVQVHPGKEDVEKMGKGNSKKEFWFVFGSNEGKLNIGFNKNTNKDEIKNHIDKGSLQKILDYKTVKRGETYLINPGTVHAICSGSFILEIQEPSDTTYRLYDYDRIGKDGKKRELHVEDSLKCLNTKFGFEVATSERYQEQTVDNTRLLPLTKNDKFFINQFKVAEKFTTQSGGDYFEVITIVEGIAEINWGKETMKLYEGDIVLIPAKMWDFTIHGQCTFLQINTPTN